MLAGRAAVAAVGVLLMAVLAGCGSAPAPTVNPNLGAGRSLQQTCPLVGKALRAGFVSPAQLSTLSATTSRLVRSGNSQTKRVLAPLSGDARTLAGASDSQQALTSFQQAVTGVQDACTKQGDPMTF